MAAMADASQAVVNTLLQNYENTCLKAFLFVFSKKFAFSLLNQKVNWRKVAEIVDVCHFNRVGLFRRNET